MREAGNNGAKKEVDRQAGPVPLSFNCLQLCELSSQSLRLPGQVGTDGKVFRNRRRGREDTDQMLCPVSDGMEVDSQEGLLARD